MSSNSPAESWTTFFLLHTEAEREWAAHLYHSPEFQSVRARYIESSAALANTPPGPVRSRLVGEVCELKG